MNVNYEWRDIRDTKWARNGQHWKHVKDMKTKAWVYGVTVSTNNRYKETGNAETMHLP